MASSSALLLALLALLPLLQWLATCWYAYLSGDTLRPQLHWAPSNGQVEVDGGGGGLVEGNADNQLDYVVPR